MSEYNSEYNRKMAIDIMNNYVNRNRPLAKRRWASKKLPSWEFVKQRMKHSKYPITHRGEPITLSNLPPKDFGVGAGANSRNCEPWYFRESEPNSFHWNEEIKALVLLAIYQGVISLPDALVRYSMHIEEFIDWHSGFIIGDLRCYALVDNKTLAQ